ncbi:hypothetical protein [Sansalvadorimonas verongulae]|uniref:hypothetical protein n=1 Tax=Sansalvadorimonas verongulae TaxID=2172824 RepID=UPI0012BCC3A7|nr:hypothetical protein [Sansalvadorimonas verongulae]MTI12356.1 hypothetical protein [Sansalvadorimonas verongulae]
MSALSDSDLNALIHKAPPTRHGDLWVTLRDAFCDCQIALRQREGSSVLPAEMLARLIHALYRYGCATTHPSVHYLFPFEAEVHGIAPLEFLLENQQHFKLRTPATFMGCMADILADDPSKEWSGFVQQNRADVSQIGMVCGYGISSKVLEIEDSVGIAIPLANPSKEAGVGLEGLLRGISCQRVDDTPVSRARAQQCYEEELARQRESDSETRQLIIDDIEKQLDDIESWDETLPRPHYTGKEWHIGEHSDSVFMSLPIFLEEEDKPQVEWGNLVTLIFDSGSKEEVADVPEDLRTFQCQRTKRDGIPDVVVHDKTTGDNYIYITLNHRHGAAFLIAQELYRIAGFKTMDVTRIRRDDKSKCHLLISLPMQDTSGKQGGESFCYKHETVMARMRDGARYGAAVVFDALLKNDDVANSRMAIISQPDHKNIMRTYVYRSEFHCLGYSRKTIQQKAVESGVPLGSNVVNDLNTLLKEECFKSARHHNQIRLGMERLGNLQDETFHEVVARYWPGSQSDAQVVAEQLLQRKAALLSMSEFAPSPDRLEKPLAPVFHEKRHVAAVRALCESHGEMELPNIVAGGKPLETRGRLRTLLCHTGDAQERGGYITLHRIGDVWFVVDDLKGDGEGGISLDEYVSQKGLKFLVDGAFPAGIATLENMLKCGFLRTTPELMLWELEAAEKRREWHPDFEQAVIKSWQSACGYTSENTSDDESSDAFIECVSHFSDGRSPTDRVKELEPEFAPELPVGLYNIPHGARIAPVSSLFVEVVQNGKRVKIPPASLT